ncbi:PREDICTED: protein FAM227B-like isoform X3 [Priapulus caudatus]|uniref:Protein FAM227B-like isoform X3 n=1 Tax=Priapulus caudatus TaxID=37621 RepID=A0ABM1E0Z8_PRICU|nr:PREDICTED: protein FAM227B-like isoform X3 [Priapulus caudatus]
MIMSIQHHRGKSRPRRGHHTGHSGMIISAGMEEINRVVTPIQAHNPHDTNRKHAKDVSSTDTLFILGCVDRIGEVIGDEGHPLYGPQAKRSSCLIIKGANHAEHDGASLSPRCLLQRNCDTNNQGQFAGVSAADTPFSTKDEKEKALNQQQHSTSYRPKTVLPRFIELYQYPGFKAVEITPLPEGANIDVVILRVVNAQSRLHWKAALRAEFFKIISRNVSKALLLDTFWWAYLDKFQPHKSTQQKLFDRISKNYVRLILEDRFKYRDFFMKEYPDILAQLVFAALCESFPHSLSQFGEELMANLLNLTMLWMTGTKPAPQHYQKWNTAVLQPCRQLETECNTGSRRNSKRVSAVSFPSPSVAAVETVVKETKAVARRQSLTPSNPVISVLEKCQDDAARGTEEGKHNKTTDPKKTRSPSFSSCSQKTLYDKSESEGKIRSAATTAGDHKSSSLPIIDFNAKRLVRESQPAGRSEEFSRSVFNIHGQSPLVRHYLSTRNLDNSGSISVLVRRTEIEKPPPPDCKTYRDIIKESLQLSKDVTIGHKRALEGGMQSKLHIEQHYQEEMKSLLSLHKQLLANPRCVKKMSDQIIMNLKTQKEYQGLSLESVERDIMKL